MIPETFCQKSKPQCYPNGAFVCAWFLKWVGSWLQPRLAHSDNRDALLVTLQASLPPTDDDNGVSSSLCASESGRHAAAEVASFTAPSLRLWMCARSKLMVSTTYSPALLATLDLPALTAASQPKDAGEVVTLLVDRMTQCNVTACRAVENKLFRVKGALQQASLTAGADAPVPWRQLTNLRAAVVPLHYECIMLRRYSTPQRDALEALERFASRGPLDQPFFSERSLYTLREMALRQHTLVESLDALVSTGQVLSDQLLAHVAWRGAQTSQRLAYLGGLIGVLGSASVAIDVVQYLNTLYPAVAEVTMAVADTGAAGGET
jgi:hypothetical protein